MKTLRVRYRQDADSASVDHYALSADGAVVAAFAKPTGQVDAVEQAVDVTVDLGAGAHTFTLAAVAPDGTSSPVSGSVVSVLPLAAPFLIAVEPA